jgi:hypothetical protein
MKYREEWEYLSRRKHMKQTVKDLELRLPALKFLCRVKFEEELAGQ